MQEKWFRSTTNAIINLPNSFQMMFHDYDVTLNKIYDSIMVFVYSLEDMKSMIHESIDHLHPQGFLYLVYPKMKNTIGLKGIHRDHILPFLQVDQATGYVENTLMRFNKMVAFDDNFTLLGVKKDVTMKSRPTISQKTEDYISYIPELIKQLEGSVKNKFVNLTPGYQRGWARYIYSSKSLETQLKHLEEMKVIIELGFKSKELYTQSLSK